MFKIIDVGCNPKQFDRGRPKILFLFFFIFGRKRKCRRRWKFLSLQKNENESHLCLGLYHRTYRPLRFSCEHNIFRPNANGIFGMKNKNKTKMKINFRPKTQKKRKWPNSPFSGPKAKRNFGQLLVWWLDLSDSDPLRFYDISIYATACIDPHQTGSGVAS